MTDLDNALAPPATLDIDLAVPVAVHTLPGFDRPLPVNVREIPLLAKAPWVRTLGKLTMEVTTQGWRFPTPVELGGQGRGRSERKDQGADSSLALDPSTI